MYEMYTNVNNLFIYLAANQRITIMDDFRDSKAQLKHLADLEDPNYIEDDNLIYPSL